MIYRVILFLILNFAALGIGGLFTGKGVPSDWYLSLNKAPWTPPGWVFGTAWTTIMICFSIYLAYLWPTVSDKRLLVLLYVVQWVLNVSWNPAFFHFHAVGFALLLIMSLTLLVGFFLIYFRSKLGWWTVFILPYTVWLLIATSLNAYIMIKN